MPNRNYLIQQNSWFEISKRIAKIKGLEYCWQRLIPLIQNTYSNSYNSGFEPSILIRFCQRVLNVKGYFLLDLTQRLIFFTRVLLKILT